MPEESDHELAIKAARGDGAAFGRLLARHYDRIHRMAWRLTGTRADAEDTAQEVCVKLATAIRTFRGEAEVSTWIWRVTYNAATDLLRGRQRVTNLGPSDMMGLVESSGEVAPDDALENQELWSAVRRLSGQQRDAVLLVYGEDHSHADAARIMGCTEKTVSWHLFEARKRLKAMLETTG